MWWALPLGLVIGAVMGSLGGGGAILTIPLLVYVLHQDPHSATVGSLVIVAISSLVALAPHARRVQWRDGVVFGGMGILGSMLGSAAAVRVQAAVLMSLFSVLLLAVAWLMLKRRSRSTTGPAPAGERRGFWPLLATASGVGLLTGFFGVGGGFAVMPALTLVLGFTIHQAVATSLLVICINCVSALASRAGVGIELDWGVVLPFAVGASLGSLAGGRIARLLDPRILQLAFACLLVLLSLWIGAQNIPQLF